MGSPECPYTYLASAASGLQQAAAPGPLPPRGSARPPGPEWAKVTLAAALAYPVSWSPAPAAPELCTPRDERARAVERPRHPRGSRPSPRAARPSARRPALRGRSRRDASGRKRRRPAGKKEPPARWAPRPGARTPHSRVGAGARVCVAGPGPGSLGRRGSAEARRAVFVSLREISAPRRGAPARGERGGLPGPPSRAAGGKDPGAHLTRDGVPCAATRGGGAKWSTGLGRVARLF